MKNGSFDRAISTLRTFLKLTEVGDHRVQEISEIVGRGGPHRSDSFESKLRWYPGS